MATPTAPSSADRIKPHWLLGDIPAMTRDPLRFLTRAVRERGDFVRLRFPGAPQVIVGHPDLVEEVLLTQSASFKKAGEVQRLSPLFGNGLFSSEGDFWRRQRRMMQPAFHRQRLEAYGRTMTTYTERLLETWRDGDVRDIHEEMVRVTLDVAGKTLFDAELTDGSAMGDALATAFDHYVRKFSITQGVLQLMLLMLVPDWFPTPGNRQLRHALRRLDAMVHRFIEEHRAAGEDRGDLLSMLLQARDDDGNPMTEQQLRNEVITFYFGGHETTALALTWAWFLLAEYPEVEQKLLEELEGVLDGRAPTATDLPRLPYTEAVIKESLRLYPPNWVFVGRKALRDIEIGGHPVRRGTDITLSPWVVHRDPRFFDDPEVMRPERWLDGSTAALPRLAFFPFGGGQRMCIAANFAMMEAVIVLATIAQRYRLIIAPDQVVVPEPAMTLRPKGGLRMVIQKR